MYIFKIEFYIERENEKYNTNTKICCIQCISNLIYMNAI